jgi:hypothetical protein
MKKIDRSEQPKRLKKRPQWHGMPIPYIALIRPDGEPDFRVTDMDKRNEVMLRRTCQLCGDNLGKWIFFTGGEAAAKANQYFEPAAHLDCLLYAMQVCPFIAGRLEHADLGKIQEEYKNGNIARVGTHPESGVRIQVQVDETYTTVKSPFWVIKKASDWRFLSTPGGTILLYPTGIVHETKALEAEKMSAADWEVVREQLR